MQRQAFIFTLIIVGILVDADFGLAQRKKSEFVWPTIRLRNSLRELPAELKSVVPFETDSWFNVKDAENREQPYLQTLIMIDQRAHGTPPFDWFAERNGALQFAANSDIKRRYKTARQDIEKIEYFKRKSKRWSPRRKRYEVDDRYKARLTKALKKIVWIYDELEAAQEQRTKCYMHSGLNSRQKTSFSFQDVQGISEAIVAVEPIDGLAWLRVCKIHLTICRDMLNCDLRGFGELDERFALENLLMTGLAQTQDEQEIDRCIVFLKEHLEKTEGIDLVVEKAKIRFIRTALALNDLRDKNYDRNIAPWTEEEAIMNLLNAAFEHAGGSAGSIADDLEELLDPKYAAVAQFTDEEIKGLKETIEKLRNVRQQNRGGVAGKPMAMITNSMTREDFANEIKIQQTRFREIEAACRKPANERAKDLEMLQVLWTIDPGWKKSPILRYISCYHINDNEFYMRASRRAALCLAVAAKWRLAHNGKLPPSIEEAFEFANIDDIPKDPYCDKLLKMSSSKVATVVTSTGPDAGKELSFEIEFDF